MVNPLRFEAAPVPGKTIDLPFRINNTSSIAAQAIDLRLADLSQAPEGHWLVIDANAGPAPHGASALGWIELSEKRLEVPAATTLEVILSVRVPRDARGVYFAALLAETPRQPGATGLVVRVRFLIPIILRIQGAPARQRVELDAVTMAYQEADEGERSPTTMAGLSVANRGQTFPRIRGQLLIDQKNGDHWRPVTRVDAPERGIIPGVTLNLGDDLHRRLPSGKYRLRGLLWVDGRRAGTLEREVDFIGDPNVDTLAYDTTLGLEPDIVRMNAVPGATRATIIHIENPSEYSVDVRIEATTPRALRGMVLGDIRGDGFSAAPWTAIRPSEFTIRPGGRQSVRVIGAVPRDGALHPNYYADIVLHGTYADGQSAGDTHSTVHLVNAGIETELLGIVDQMQLAEGEDPSKYVVQARFLNIGNTHVMTNASVQVLGVRSERVLQASLSGDEGPLLPLGIRIFSEELNFARIDPGNYVVRTTVDYGPASRAMEQLAVEVTEDDGVRRVTVLGSEPTIQTVDDISLPSAANDTSTTVAE